MDTDKLISRALHGDATRDELLFLSRWLEESDDHRARFEELKRAWNLVAGITATPGRRARALARYTRYLRRRRLVASWRRVTWRAAAALLPLAAALYLLDREASPPDVVLVTGTGGIVPGSYRALLTTGTGDTVSLSPSGRREIALEAGGKAVNDSSGIAFAAFERAAGAAGSHVLQTPRGGEYRATLGDGTRVYLNASSSLRFPARFDASSREVFLSGEAYFEVTGDGRPFHVVTGDGPRVTVYGTSFNVNTRPSRGTRIVLVSGRIGVRGPRDTTERFLSPSRMIEYDGEGVFRSEREVNASLYTAWMKGRFVFRDESLEEVMEVLCRWYNVEVTYETPGLKGYHLTGDIEKYGEIDVILDAISRVVGVTFERRERSITVKEQAGWPGTL